MNETEQNCTLSPRQERLLAAILEAPSVDAAAKTARVARGTVYNWLRDPEFKEELARRQCEIFSEALLG